MSPAKWSRPAVPAVWSDMCMGLRLAIFGTGKTASALIKQASQPDHTIVAGIVYDQAKAGSDIGELTGGPAVGITAVGEFSDALAGSADVLIYTGLAGATMVDLIRRCATNGVDFRHSGVHSPDYCPRRRSSGRA